MFNVGGAELLVIALVALIVLGPQRLPSAMKQIGQFVGELRRMSSGFQAELKSAFDETQSDTPTVPGTAADRLRAGGESTSASGPGPTAADAIVPQVDSAAPDDPSGP